MKGTIGWLVAATAPLQFSWTFYAVSLAASALSRKPLICSILTASPPPPPKLNDCAAERRSVHRGCGSPQAQHGQWCQQPARAFPPSTGKDDRIGMEDCNPMTSHEMKLSQTSVLHGGNPRCSDPNPAGAKRRPPTGTIRSCRPLCSPSCFVSQKARDNWEWEQKVRTRFPSDVQMSKRCWHGARGNKEPAGSMWPAGMGVGCKVSCWEKAIPEPAEQQCHRLETSAKMLSSRQIPKWTQTHLIFIFP